MNTILADTLKTVVDSTKTIVDSTLVNAAPIVEKSIWQDKSLMTVIAFIGGVLILGIAFIVWDSWEERKEKRERKK